ncbi:MAG: aldehyde ferredoxin oxidoreductase family protein, partial [Chloroflexota bacterium]
MVNGWAGRTLHVDLSSGRMRPEPLDLEFARTYLGGRGVNSRLLYDAVRGDVDEFGPENVLIFGVGPLGGTLAPSSSRYTVTSKSPSTNIFSDSCSGGQFGPELKQAGYDHLIFTGRADKPVYLLIENDQVELLDADWLWGENAWNTQKALRKRLGDDIQVATIGQAGENRVRYAGILHGLKRAAGKFGMGAVMGSKNLKAIAIRGTKGIGIADPKRFMAACRQAHEAIKAHPFYKRRSVYGTPLQMDLLNELGALSTRNFESSVDENVDAISGVTLTRNYSRGMRSCFACPVHCTHYYSLEAGPYKGTYGEGPEFTVTSMIGNRCGCYDMEAILHMNKLLNEYGMDPAAMGGLLGWAMDCYAHGILNSSELDGLELTWGNSEAMIALIHKTACREGFGGVLAEGEKRAPAIVGRGSEKLMHHIKGGVVIIEDPRALKGFGLAYITSSRGSDHLRGYYILDQGGLVDVAAKVVEDPEAADPLTPVGKGKGVKWFEDYAAVVDALALCKFNWVSMVDLSSSSDRMAELVESCTGWRVDGAALLRAGERIYNVEKAFNARLGLDRKADNFSVPEKFLEEPLPDGGGKGEIFELDQMLDDYYTARGWGLDGLPKRAKRDQLGLW